MGLSPPGLFSFPSPSARVRIFPPFVRPRHHFLFPCPRILCVYSLLFLLLIPSDLGYDIGTLLQTLTVHAGASGLAALASRNLAR